MGWTNIYDLRLPAWGRSVRSDAYALVCPLGKREEESCRVCHARSEESGWLEFLVMNNRPAHGFFRDKEKDTHFVLALTNENYYHLYP